jgi:ATPase subunit of ABC transporter with duplicated ATPase domains
MSLLAVRDLAVTLGAPLFSGLDLHLAKSDRLGLVAANGRGKSTLLRALAGLHEPTAGEVTRARGLRVGLVGQDVPPDLMALTLREATLTGLPPEEADESWRADIVLDDLDVADDLRDRPLAALSGGWQRTALLARAWVAEPDVLLLDEPTNHLDLHRIGVLQGWLKTAARSAAMIAASHDRAFLDAARTARSSCASASRLFALPLHPRPRGAAGGDAADGRRFENDLTQAAQQLRRRPPSSRTSASTRARTSSSSRPSSSRSAPIAGGRRAARAPRARRGRHPPRPRRRSTPAPS